MELETENQTADKSAEQILGNGFDADFALQEKREADFRFLDKSFADEGEENNADSFVKNALEETLPEENFETEPNFSHSAVQSPAETQESSSQYTEENTEEETEKTAPFVLSKPLPNLAEPVIVEESAERRHSVSGESAGLSFKRRFFAFLASKLGPVIFLRWIRGGRSRAKRRVYAQPPSPQGSPDGFSQDFPQNFPQSRFRRRGSAAMRVFGVFSVLIVMFASVLVVSGAPYRPVEWLARNMGLVLSEAFVVNRQRVSADELRRIAGLSVGQTIFSIELEQVRQNVLSLPWVAEARVERHLPDRIVLHIRERVPVAIHQNEDVFMLISRSGLAILPPAGKDFKSLPVISGTSNHKEIAQFMALIETWPELHSRLVSAHRVNGRRWRFELADKTVIELPEQDTPRALKRLLWLHQEYNVLLAGDIVIDLRLPDRAAVRYRGLKKSSSSNDNRRS